MPYLSFIDDTTFTSLVSKTLEHGHDAKKKVASNFDRNVIDPFSILWEMSAFDSNFDAWYKMEVSRQAQKTLSNHVGMFHQNFLGSINGWQNLGVGQMVDLVNTEKKIIAEVKNKHNTVTGGKLVDLYNELRDLVMPNGQTYKGYTAYYVEIIPKKPIRTDTVFTPPDKKTSTKCPSNEKIRKIDGASFYTLVTGVEDALEQVFNALPKVIKDLYPQFDERSSQSAYVYYQKAYTSSFNKSNS